MMSSDQRASEHASSIPEPSIFDLDFGSCSAAKVPQGPIINHLSQLPLKAGLSQQVYIIMGLWCESGMG
ncbi:unnamed protein product [Boreogadus saida]